MNQAILIVLVLATLSSASKGAAIVDEDGSVDIKNVAELVCDVAKGSGRQIGRVATIGRLAEFFKTLPADHKLAKCRDQYGESVARLQLVLETGNGNVCGNAKVTAIEQFHKRYISGVKKYKKEREASGWMAPKLVKLVFMHYAHLVSSICERSAAIELAQVGEKIAAPGESDSLIAQISEVAGVSDLSKGYDSVFNLWNLLDKLPLEKSEKFSRYLSSAEGSRRRLSVAVLQAAKLRKVQEQCGQVMRPIYARSLLGVLRLVDLGYYPEDDFLANEVREMPTSRRLFVMTQVCEILLPIAVVEDKTLSPDQIVMLPKDEASADDVVEESEEYTEVAENSLKDLENLEVAYRDSAKGLARELKRAVRRRDDAIKMAFKSMISCFKTKIKSKIGSMLISNAGAHERALDEDLASKVNEKDLASLIEEDSKLKSSELSRRKRGLGSVFAGFVGTVKELIKGAISLVIAVIYFAIYWTVILCLDLIYVLFFKLTGVRLLWIRNFRRAYLSPLVESIDRYKEIVAQDKD